MSTPTPEQILATPMPENDADAATIRDALVDLLAKLWNDKECFNGKRPFGESAWEYAFYEALGSAGYIRYERDESGYCTDVDSRAGDQLIATAIRALGKLGVSA